MACDSSGFILLQISDLVYSHRETCRGSNPLLFIKTFLFCRFFECPTFFLLQQKRHVVVFTRINFLSLLLLGGGSCEFARHVHDAFGIQLSVHDFNEVTRKRSPKLQKPSFDTLFR